MMPVVFIHGVPEGVSQQILERTVAEIQTAISEISNLNIKPDQVTVFFPPDRMLKGLGEEIIVTIEGLYESPKRTTRLLRHLAHICGSVVSLNFPSSFVECFVHTINPVAGVWSTKNQPKPR
ncbi:MAG: hypothetical protein HQ402_01860 [Parcubacteria group bacterium]|nr:hypothetical protein [Parcubacteria group bacterium]